MNAFHQIEPHRLTPFCPTAPIPTDIPVGKVDEVLAVMNEHKWSDVVGAICLFLGHQNSAEIRDMVWAVTEIAAHGDCGFDRYTDDDLYCLLEAAQSLAGHAEDLAMAINAHMEGAA